MLRYLRVVEFKSNCFECDREFIRTRQFLFGLVLLKTSFMFCNESF